MPDFPSICRNCIAYCPVVVTVENGKAVKVAGDREAPLYDGYTCPKGRTLPEQLNHPRRLLRCLTRNASGELAPTASETVISEIAGRLQELLDRHGPQSIAVFNGTGNVTNPNGSAMARAWLQAIGSKMMFSVVSIDKPAANISVALHGNWNAGTHPFEQSDAWMIVGANPVIAKSNGAPLNNPGRRFKEAIERGMRLIVIDPRKTETAKRADVHLQAIPGEDPAILAGMIHIILAEGLHDAGFVAANAIGLSELREGAAAFTPEYVAVRSGIPADDLLKATRIFAGGRRGSVVCATGPSFSTNSNLSFYLALCINTLCGRWVRAGEEAPYPNVLLPSYVPKAQPYPPYPAIGDYPFRFGGLKENASGMPTAALADQILEEGSDQVRALICFGGNPMLSWPDQEKTERALRKLEMLVVMDHQPTATAKLADYIIPCPLALETACATTRIEALKYLGVARGFDRPWAQYAPKVVDPPSGSDLIEDWAFFFRLAQKMQLQLRWTTSYGMGPHQESEAEVTDLDMSRMPTNEALIELTCKNSRVPLSEVKSRPHGGVFDKSLRVEPRDNDCTAMLQLADPLMMEALARLKDDRRPDRGQQELLLMSRRINNAMNSVGQSIDTLMKGRIYTPAFMHPLDMSERNIAPDDIIAIRSKAGEILAQVESDDTLRPGTMSAVQGFAEAPDPRSGARRLVSTSVTRLVSMDEYDPITGIPRMSAIPVEVSGLPRQANSKSTSSRRIADIKPRGVV